VIAHALEKSLRKQQLVWVRAWSTIKEDLKKNFERQIDNRKEDSETLHGGTLLRGIELKRAETNTKSFSSQGLIRKGCK
jgi:hypothetical protein